MSQSNSDPRKSGIAVLKDSGGDFSGVTLTLRDEKKAAGVIYFKYPRVFSRSMILSLKSGWTVTSLRSFLGP